MCNPDDQHPCIDDTHSPAQHHHDTLLTGLHTPLTSGKPGKHNGLPASIIVTTTLAESETATGCDPTGGGTLLPTTEVIRLARHPRPTNRALRHGPQI